MQSYKSYENTLYKYESKFSLIEDNPSLESYTDAYNYSGYAKTIANHIISTSTKNSFGIAVIGEWGSGKSDFLLRLKENLVSSKENLILNFNPWRVNKSDAIIDEFFKSLSSTLRPYNRMIATKIKEYSTRILQNSKEAKHRLYDTIINEFITEESIDKNYDSINTAIQKTGKRIVVFIDDMDRLTGKEVMEVLRLVRNSANFANTFFIIGIDQNYIVNVLKTTNHFTNEQEYLKKIFQLVIALPKFKKEIFIDEIKKQLSNISSDSINIEKLNGSLEKLSYYFLGIKLKFSLHEENGYLIESLLNNMRDLKRFCNSFKVAYNTGTLKDDADLHDLLVLELIKNKSIDVYNKIKNRIVIDEDILHYSTKYNFNEENWQHCVEELKNVYFTMHEINALKVAVKYLITAEAYKSLRRFAEPHNFYIYFSYNLFDLIPMGEFLNVIESDVETIVSTFQGWIDSSNNNDDKEQELKIIAKEYIKFKNAKIFKNVIISYLTLSAKSAHDFFDLNQWYRIVENILNKKRFENLSNCFNNDRNLYLNFLSEIMKEKNIQIQYRAALAEVFLLEHINDNYSDQDDYLTLKKREWQEIILDLFNEFVDIYLSSSIFTFRRLMRLYYINRDNIKNHIYIHFPKSNEKFRSLLSHNDHVFTGYTSVLLEEPSSSEHGQGIFRFEGCLIEIFGSWKNYKDRLLSFEFIDSDLEYLKGLILKYIDSYFTENKKEFEMEKNEVRFMTKWWKKIYKGLNIDPYRDIGDLD